MKRGLFVQEKRLNFEIFVDISLLLLQKVVPLHGFFFFIRFNEKHSCDGELSIKHYFINT